MSTFPKVIEGCGPPIKIRYATLTDALGYWNPRDCEIVLDKRVCKTGQHVVMIHEFMHVIETHLKTAGIISKNINHTYITCAATMLLALLVQAGIVKKRGVTLKSITDMLKSETTTPWADTSRKRNAPRKRQPKHVGKGRRKR